MVNNCVVAGCFNTHKGGDISFHQFPLDPKRREIWTKQVQKTRANWSGPTAHSKVCSDHFELSCYDDEYSLYLSFGLKRKRTLKPHAYPTIFPDDKTNATNEDTPTSEKIRTLIGALPSIRPREQHSSADKDDEETPVSRYENGTRSDGKTTRPRRTVRSKNKDEQNAGDDLGQDTQLPASASHQPFITTDQLNTGSELQAPVNDIPSSSDKQQEQTTPEGMVHLVVADSVVPLVTSPLPNVKVVYLIKPKSQSQNNESRFQQQVPQQQVIFPGQTTLGSNPGWIQTESVDHLQDNPHNSQDDAGTPLPVHERLQGCQPHPGLVSNPGEIKTSPIEQLPVVQVKQEIPLEFQNDQQALLPVKQQILTGQADPGLVSNQEESKLFAVQVKVKQEPFVDFNNDVSCQQPVFQEKLNAHHEGEMDSGLGWIKSEPSEQVSDAGLGNDLLFFTNTGDEVPMDVCVEGKDKDENDAEVFVKHELFQEEETSDSGVDRRDEDMIEYFQDINQTSDSDENAAMSEDDEDEDEDENEDDALETEDNSSDEDYVPEDDFPEDDVSEDDVSEDDVPASKTKTRAGQRKLNTTVQQDVQVRLLYKCKTCQERFEKAESMRTHYTKTHPNTDKQHDSVQNESPSPRDGDIQGISTILKQCWRCKKYVEDMESHLKCHPSFKFVSEVCGRRLLNSKTLHKHQESHKIREDRKLHKCPECDKIFRTKSLLSNHIENKICKPNCLVCEKCGKQFGKLNRLKRHKLVHMEEKPFKCSECGRGFNQRGNMKLHMRMHTGEKPYQCQICQEGFNHNVSLKNHQKKKHGIDWWKDKQKGKGD